jgi:hypothetical protein
MARYWICCIVAQITIEYEPEHFANQSQLYQSSMLYDHGSGQALQVTIHSIDRVIGLAESQLRNVDRAADAICRVGELLLGMRRVGRGPASIIAGKEGRPGFGLPERDEAEPGLSCLWRVGNPKSKQERLENMKRQQNKVVFTLGVQLVSSAPYEWQPRNNGTGVGQLLVVEARNIALMTAGVALHRPHESPVRQLLFSSISWSITWAS